MENGLVDPTIVVPPWLDLPTHLAEEILVRLPLSGYVMFAAVCRQWRSIQTAHRRRHAPSPPPMRSLPWLIPILPPPNYEEAVSCYSPLEDRSYVIRLPSNNGTTRYHRLYTHGWLWAEDSGHTALFNPISATRIDLPPLDKRRERSLRNIISPPPNYVVSFVVSVVPFRSRLALLRWCDPAWSMFSLPPGVPVNSRARRGPAVTPMTAISCGGKHYYIFRDGSGLSESYTHDLLLVDPLPSPTIQFFKMMSCWGKQQGGAEGRYGDTHVVELDGELLLVKEIINNSEMGDLLAIAIAIGFHVFRADLCKKMWVRVESLGNHVIFVHQHGLVSLLAADVGLKRNCIYFSTFVMPGIDTREAPWKVFDLGTGTVADVLIPNATNVQRCSQHIFMPSIC